MRGEVLREITSFSEISIHADQFQIYFRTRTKTKISNFASWQVRTEKRMPAAKKTNFVEKNSFLISSSWKPGRLFVSGSLYLKAELDRVYKV